MIDIITVQNHISMNYLKLISSMVLLSALINCSDRDADETLVSGTYIYINETSESVYIAGNCGFVNNSFSGTEVAAGDTMTLSIFNELTTGGGISINDKYVFYSGLSCEAIYGDSVKCSYYPLDFRLMKNYENRKEISKNNLELTYRFTEETKAAAPSCQ